MKTTTSQSEMNAFAQLASPWPRYAIDDIRLRTAALDQNETGDMIWQREIWGTPHNSWTNYHTWCVYFSIAGRRRHLSPLAWNKPPKYAKRNPT